MGHPCFKLPKAYNGAGDRVKDAGVEKMKTAGPLWALGTMSGTSLDGVDAAMVLTDGERILDFGPSAYRPYSDAERATIRAAFGQWPGDPNVAKAAEVVETAHAELLSRFSGADVVGFHGQTILHQPERGRTWQIGDGARLADLTGIAVVNDFKSVEGDKALGLQSLPVVFGVKRASWISATMIDLFQIAMVVALVLLGQHFAAVLLTLLIIPQITFQDIWLLRDPILFDVKYQASAQPFLVIGMLVTALALGHSGFGG